MKCVLCSKRQPKSLQPQMADLPVERPVGVRQNAIHFHWH